MVKGEKPLNNTRVENQVVKQKNYYLLVIIWIVIIFGFVYFFKLNIVLALLGTILALIMIFFERQIRRML